jgi:hypothetical protein
MSNRLTLTLKKIFKTILIIFQARRKINLMLFKNLNLKFFYIAFLTNNGELE